MLHGAVDMPWLDLEPSNMLVSSDSYLYFDNTIRQTAFAAACDSIGDGNGGTDGQGTLSVFEIDAVVHIIATESYY